MVLRLEAGASAPQHTHPAGGECVMLAGDVFLGDLLLRQGEFQWAPAGIDHGLVYSDIGRLIRARPRHFLRTATCGSAGSRALTVDVEGLD